MPGATREKTLVRGRKFPISRHIFLKELYNEEIGNIIMKVNLFILLS